MINKSDGKPHATNKLNATHHHIQLWGFIHVAQSLIRVQNW